MNQSLSDFIKESALKVGFDACGIARASALPEDASFFSEWLEKGCQGEMGYLERNFDKRTNPQLLVPGCKSIVVVALNYYTDKKQPQDAPKVAMYAFPEKDYHLVVKEMLAELEKILCDELGSHIVNQEHQHSFVDSAPVLERSWAQQAGLGWIGKSSMLINPTYGSYVFLGELMLSIELPYYNTPIDNQCGTCEKCIKACPMSAITDTFFIANRCISYHTNERKSEFQESEKVNLSNYICGCDVCMEVCPWNKSLAKPHNNKELKENDFIMKSDRKDWEGLTKSEFDRLFKTSSLKRRGLVSIKKYML